MKKTVTIPAIITAVKILFISALLAQSDKVSFEDFKVQMKNPSVEARGIFIQKYLKDRQEGDEVLIIAELSKALPKDSVTIERGGVAWQYIQMLGYFSSEVSVDWLLSNINIHSSDLGGDGGQEVFTRASYFPSIGALLQIGGSAKTECERILISELQDDNSIVDAMCLFLKTAHNRLSEYPYKIKGMPQELIDRINSVKLLVDWDS